MRGRPVPLDGGLAVLEYGAGLFPREVGWRKVTAAGRLADGRPVALHLVDGLPGATSEDGADDVLLVGTGPVALPPVVVEIDPGTATAPCRILSPDGSVDLTFQPAAAHRDSRGLLLVSPGDHPAGGRALRDAAGPGRAAAPGERACRACSRTARPGGEDGPETP